MLENANNEIVKNNQEKQPPIATDSITADDNFSTHSKHNEQSKECKKKLNTTRNHSHKVYSNRSLSNSTLVNVSLVNQKFSNSSVQTDQSDM